MGNTQNLFQYWIILGEKHSLINCGFLEVILILELLYMTINIITGTISGRDTGGFREILPLIGYQWFYTKKGWGYRKNKNIKFSVIGNRLGLIDIIHTTGGGNTLLAAINLYKANRNGDNTAANMPFSFL